ncbi:MAG: hypothetical protein H6887_10815 [Hoeflea sp.]|nr:hypothetical protein [Hoeflea sp.]
MDTIFQWLGQFVVTIGGASVLMLGLSNYFGRIFADRFIETKKAELNQELERLRGQLILDAETHRVRLRKSELVFEKEFEAVSKLVSFRRKQMPRHLYPDMDWYEACNIIAENFSAIEDGLRSFIADYGAVLSDTVVDLLSDCIGIAGQNKFEAIDSEQVSTAANKAANDLYDKLTEAEATMLVEFRKKVSE